MADRYFPNEMPEFVAESDKQDKRASDSLHELLHTPYQSLSESFKTAGLELKDNVVMGSMGLTGGPVGDVSLYCGLLGTAYLELRTYFVEKRRSDLDHCTELIKACDMADSKDVTFICGRAGVYAVGAVAAKHSGDQELLDHYLSRFREITLPSNLPNELLYGRAGYLWACLFLNKHIGVGTVSSSCIEGVAKEIINNGRSLSNKGKCPLMFEWYNKKYYGAAHGLAGIMHVLMHTNLKPDEVEDVKGTLRYLIKNRFHSGNYPASEDDREEDTLVHWCHGAPGVALTLVKAAEVFGDKEFLEAAVEAAGVVWKRGLLKRTGLCHGISGNAYVFLALYRLTGDIKFLYKAKAFACFLLDRAEKLALEGKLHMGDRPFSLFEGTGGMAFLFLDMVDPTQARFPGYEL